MVKTGIGFKTYRGPSPVVRLLPEKFELTRINGWVPERWGYTVNRYILSCGSRGSEENTVPGYCATITEYGLDYLSVHWEVPGVEFIKMYIFRTGKDYAIRSVKIVLITCHSSNKSVILIIARYSFINVADCYKNNGKVQLSMLWIQVIEWLFPWRGQKGFFVMLDEIMFNLPSGGKCFFIKYVQVLDGMYPGYRKCNTEYT
jgi:hypothetical protein